MNVFEDLIVELKQENLLERTIIDDRLEATRTETFELDPSLTSDRSDLIIERNGDSPSDEDAPWLSNDSGVASPVVPARIPAYTPAHSKPKNGQEFYRKRAMAEVSNLQMVEHVLTGVEREYMKIVPKSYDDFSAKKALNTFLQVTENENSSQHQEAEFRLMNETEAWCSALAERDRAISVASLRQYCENSRPPLSSQALVALGKFYRNLPYSPSVRAKFDFVITRLFSRASEGDIRVPVFSPEETLTHIHTLYRDWSSIALYGAEDNESQIALAALSFDDLAVEAENAGTFDQLIEKDFFGRVRNFKEAIGELFYAPNVLASAIGTNVRVGNAYVRLIALERDRLDEGSIESKYGDEHDEMIAEGVGRTIELLDLLKSPLNRSVEESDASPAPRQHTKDLATTTSLRPTYEGESSRPSGFTTLPIVEKIVTSLYGMNRWLVGTCAVLIVFSFAIYLYANFFAVEPTKETGVREVMIDDPIFKDHVMSGRVTDETLYGIVLPNWDVLTRERKQEVLTKIHQAGKEKGFSQVNLLSEDGKTVGFASGTRLDVLK